MANCEEFTIVIQNRTGIEIKATKFEYDDGTRSKIENMFLGGSVRIDDGDEKEYKRNLQGIGGESTKFTVTYQHRSGSNNWSANHVARTGTFTCGDGESKTIVLTD
jgi:hypothetical protein